jgi:hypothetical protein
MPNSLAWILDAEALQAATPTLDVLFKRLGAVMDDP